MTSFQTQAPAASIDAPSEPEWSKLWKAKVDQETAHRIWSDVVQEMTEAGTLFVTNAPAIKRYVFFQVEFERQSRAIAKSGTIRKAPKTKVPMVHPAWTIMKQAADFAVTLEAELAISPRRRKNAGKRKPKAPSRADAFLPPRQPGALRSVS